MIFIVTAARNTRDPDHDPHAKQTSTCPGPEWACTDATGEHHSWIMDHPGPIELAHRDARNALPPEWRLTRVEGPATTLVANFLRGAE